MNQKVILRPQKDKSFVLEFQQGACCFSFRIDENCAHKLARDILWNQDQQKRMISSVKKLKYFFKD